MQIKSIVPEGSSGPWKVERFEIKNDFRMFIFNMKNGGRAVQSGWFTRLTRNGAVIMTDTPAEINDHRDLRRNATGKVLIHGLGLGIALQIVLAKKDVAEVTVIEQSSDVIDLVAPSFEDPRLKVIHANAFEWKPRNGERFNAVWHDIWDNICADNLPEMHKLHRKYGRRTDWQASWCRYECERVR